MYATVWLDRETFISIIEYCRARPGYHELDADENDESVSLVETELPDLAAYDGPGQSIQFISLVYSGSLSACTRLFELGRSGEIDHPPSIEIRLKGVRFSADGAARGGAVVSYQSLRGFTARNGSVVDPMTKLEFIAIGGDAESRGRMLDLFLEKVGAGGDVRVEADGEGGHRIVSSEERYAILTRPYGGTEPAQSALREERVTLAFGLDSRSYHEQSYIGAHGLPKEELQEYALSIIDTLGRDHVKTARASWVTKDREVYDAFRGTTGDVVGEWRIHLITKGGFSVSDLVEAPERLPEEMTYVEVGFDVELPVVGLTYVAVEAERERGHAFGYRLRFYERFDFDDYERKEWPDLREQRPSETSGGQPLLPFLREVEDEALVGKGPRDWVAPAEDLAMLALFRLWGDGRDLIDYDYEE